MSAIINFSVGIVIDDDNKGRCSAFSDVTGMTVYGDTEQEASDKLYDAVLFFFDTIVKDGGVDALTAYMDRHEAAYERVEVATAPTKPRRTSRAALVHG